MVFFLEGYGVLMVGVRTDLLELTRLPYVKGFTARVFWEGGLKTIGTIAESDPGDIIPLLVKVIVMRVRND